MMSASAFASQTFTMRADYENTGKYTDATNVDQTGTSLFQAKAAKWDVATSVGEAKVDARLNFLGSASILTFAEWAFITKSMGEIGRASCRERVCLAV